MTDDPARDRLLLDTHVWIWAFHGRSERLGRDIPAVLAAARREDRLLLSAVSVWEAAYAIMRGRVPIRGTLDEWIGEAVAAFGGRIRSLDRRVALESARLPGTMHGDPADRWLVATALLIGARLVTADDRILAYAAGGHVQVLDARP